LERQGVPRGGRIGREFVMVRSIIIEHVRR
jgi:hypothetical protein